MSPPVSCGICGSHPNSLGYNKTEKRFLCGSCASYSTLGEKISLINVMSEVASLRDDINDLINDDLKYDKIDHDGIKPPPTDLSTTDDIKSPHRTSHSHNWTKLLSTRILNLQLRLQTINDHIWNSKESIEGITAKIIKQRAINEQRRTNLDILKVRLDQYYNKQKDDVSNQIIKANNEINNLDIPITSLQIKRVRDICLLFGVRKVRRKRDRLLKPEKSDKGSDKVNSKEKDKHRLSSGSPNSRSNSRTQSHKQDIIDNHSNPSPPTDLPPLPSNISFARQYDILIGFNVVPDLSILGHYSHITINASIERIASLSILLSYYMGLKLPYEVSLAHSLFPRISRPGIDKITLYVDRTVHTFAQKKPRQFELYAEGLAMLALDLAFIANAKGIHLKSPEDIAQINKTLALICNIRTEPTVTEEKPSSSSTPTPPPDEVSSLATNQFIPDLPSVHDYIITQMYLDISGGSAEWNVIDKEAIPESVDISIEEPTIEWPSERVSSISSKDPQGPTGS